MKVYQIRETLSPVNLEEISNAGCLFVAVLSQAEWNTQKALFNMGIELELNVTKVHSTKAEVNYDSMTGTFLIPDRNNLTENTFQFAYALDEKGIVFIDDSGKADEMLQTIRITRKWRQPCLERFLYDFLELIIDKDQSIMESYELDLDHMEDIILSEAEEADLEHLNNIRGDMRELRIHYEQLIDMTQELLENENDFFSEEKLRYIRLFMNRLERHHDQAASLKDHINQVLELYHTQLEVRQNQIMTILTVVTAIFMPLTLIAGWYGMNFRYMPELEAPHGYLVVVIISFIIAIGSLIVFKIKKWL